MSMENVQSNVLVLSRTNFVTFLNVENLNEEQWKLFGLWYKTEREKVGKTQEEVAEDADIHPKTVSRIENGEPTKRSTVIALAKAIGADGSEAVKRAFAPETTKREPKNKIEELAFHYPGIPEQKRDKVDYLIELLDNEIKKIEAEKLKYGEE